MIVGHVLPERRDTLRQVTHQIAEFAAAEKQQHDQQYHKPVPYAEVSHGISIFDCCTAPRPQIPNADSPMR
jgi:hypothetical protein